MRIAYLGPAPAPTSGVQHVAFQLVSTLAARMDVNVYVAGDHEIVEDISAVDGLGAVSIEAMHFEWDRWYSRTGLTSFVSGQLARADAQRRLLRRLVEDHRAAPFDLVWQFSQTELFGLRRHQAELPPIVIHPETHAGGELRWLTRERHLDRSLTMRAQRAAASGLMSGRALMQRADSQRVAGVIAPSAAFAAELHRDYRVPQDHLRIVPNPVDLERFTPPAEASTRDATVRLVFVSRMAVRKGLDQIIELSRRLDDLRGQVTIELIGDRTLWSDYRPLLDGLNADVATYVGHRSSEEMVSTLQTADGLLQPSKYEPFGITVTEALASGVPVVATATVGAVDGLPDDVCRTFPVGDDDAFERTVRTLIEDVRAHRDDLRSACRDAALQFGSEPVTDRLEAALREFAQAPRGTRYAATAA